MFSAELDLSDCQRGRDQTLHEMETGIQEATRLAAEAGADEAKRGPFKDKTGQLRSNIIAEFLRSTERSSEWAIYSPTPYSIFVEEPTRPHDIYPKAGYSQMGPLRNGQTRRGRGRGPHEHVVGRGQFLRWKDDGGEQHFAKMVHHPGTPGAKFMAMGKLVAEYTLKDGLQTMVLNIQRIWN